MSNWLNIPDTHDFSTHNLPYGVAIIKSKPSIVVAIGDQMICMQSLAQSGLLDDLGYDMNVWGSSTLNDFMSLGKPHWTATRNRIQELLQNTGLGLEKIKEEILVNRVGVEMIVPIQIGDYTDFYSSIDHATNVGIMFRDPENALLPNWKHIPVGYHGRASSIVISGTDIKRPSGQTMLKGADSPVFGPCKLLDFELEMGFIVGTGNKLGEPIPIDKADDHVFGMVVFNDWSARDIQKWEYVPLGPFLGKSFASTMSPWIVTMDALKPFCCESPAQDPKVLPYLEFEGDKNIDINLEVVIDDGRSQTTVSNSNYKHMYWNISQQLAHHTVNGCNAQTGDLMASGTISGPTEDSFGSMLELSWAGSREITLESGNKRKFLQNGDSVLINAHCEKDGIRIGFGECMGKVIE